MYKTEKPRKETGTLNTEEKTADAAKKKGAAPRQRADDSLRNMIEEYVTKALKNAQTLWEKDLESRISQEREDAARMASMSSEERAKAEMDKRQKDFESEREQYMSERAEFEAAKELAANGISVGFARMVADADREIMTENINTLKSELMKSVEEGISERLKGRAPRVSKERDEGEDPFLSGLGL